MVLPGLPGELGGGMNGDGLMKCLIVAYVILAAVYAYERNFAKSWYWLGAAQITASVLVMK